MGFFRGELTFDVVFSCLTSARLKLHHFIENQFGAHSDTGHDKYALAVRKNS